MPRTMTRRVEIEVKNETKFRWKGLKAAFSSGTSESHIPHDVGKNQSIKFTGVQRSFSLFTGTAGVFTYNILDDENKDWKTLVVMWDVPFDYNIWKSNRWQVEVKKDKNVQATRQLFRKQRKHPADPKKGEDQWEEFSTDEFNIEGCMTSNSDSKLTIVVKDR